MHSFLFKFTLFLNSVLLFWKLLVFEFPLGMLKTLVCSVSAPLVKIVPLLICINWLCCSHRAILFEANKHSL